MKEDLIKVVFAGGGTGGHIYPGLAVCDELRRICKENGKQVQIHWIGNSRGMDRTIVENNFDSEGNRSADVFKGIPSGKLRRYLSFRNFLDLFKIFGGLVSSFFYIGKVKPQVLFSKGGFVSVPPCMSAKAHRIPVFTHECDFTPGLATRLNSKSAAKVLISYEETSSYLGQKFKDKTVVTGNPVRPVFYSAQAEKGLEFLGIEKNHTKPVLLVLGGSLGARQINDLVSENLEWLKERFIVVHQTGNKNQAASEQNDENYKAYPFIYKEMPDVIKACDIVLSRAGANSIWECSVCGKPMVLIPLCGSGTRGDQVDNAEFFERKGAAIVLTGEKAASENLKSALEKIAESDNLKSYADNSLKFSEGRRPAEKIAHLIYEQIQARGK